MNSLVIVTPGQHQKAAEARARGSSQTGLTEAGRQALRDHGPMTSVELAARMPQFTALAVRSRFNACSYPKGVYCDHAKPPRFDVKPFTTREVVTEVRGVKPLVGYGRYLVSNWDLCARDPFATSRAAVFSHKGCA